MPPRIGDDLSPRSSLLARCAA